MGLQVKITSVPVSLVHLAYILGLRVCYVSTCIESAPLSLPYHAIVSRRFQCSWHWCVHLLVFEVVFVPFSILELVELHLGRCIQKVLIALTVACVFW